jgi:cobaltochelatase CobN
MDKSRSTRSLPRVRLLIAARTHGAQMGAVQVDVARMDAAQKDAAQKDVAQMDAAQRDDDVAWQDWQAARQASPHGSRMALQRVLRAGDTGPRFAVGLGYGETLRWFAPIDGPERRRMIIEYAGAVLDADGFPDAPAGLAAVACAAAAVSAEPASAEIPVTAGLVLLSHAETDLLALERARAELPPDFPRVAGHSLLGLSGPEALFALFGARRSTKLLAIVRIHGTVSSVAGLSDLVGLAHREGWGLVVISGVGGSVDMLPRTSNVKPESASNLTSYFMAGGASNVAHALRFAAAEHLGFPGGFDPPRAMPAHGLYHPDLLVTTAAEWSSHRSPEGPTAAVLFYRAHVLSGNLQFVDAALRALESRGFAAVGIFTSSLRDRDAAGIPLALRLLPVFPDIIVNTVSFPVFTLGSPQRAPPDREGAPFEAIGAPLVQAICCGTSRAEWIDSARGLSPTEAAMHVALPECDGRVISVPISFKENHRYLPDLERVQRAAGLAQRLAVLRVKPNAEKRIGIVLSNAGGKAQRIGGAVGLDTPASLLQWLMDLRAAGYAVGSLPNSPDALMAQLLAQGCYDEKHPIDPARAWRLPRPRYVQWFLSQSDGFQQPLCDMWGKPTIAGPTIAPPFWRSKKQAARRSPLPMPHEPYTDDGDYLFSGLRFGNVFVAIQPPRGFGVDPEAVYHATDLPPCHHYAAFYRWLTDEWHADALIHFGTHGTLEWLPGKSLALSADCAPDALLGDLPLLYPFVVNNPGEGAQAKRRAHAVIVDHLVPPLTHADNYGPLATLARLVEEYYRAEVLDTNKLPVLRRQIWDLVRTARLEDDLKQIRLERHGDHEHPWDERPGEQGVPRALERMSGRGFAHLLEDLDAYLCDLGRAQIRGGLHVFGAPPVGPALLDLLFAVLRCPNGDVPSLIDAVAGVGGIDAAVLRDSQGVWPEALSPALAPFAAGVVTVGQVRTAVDELARALLRDLAGCDFSTAHVAGVIGRRFTPAEGPSTVAPGSLALSGRAPSSVAPSTLAPSSIAPSSIAPSSVAPSTLAPSAAALTDLSRTLQFVCEILVPNLARTTDETRQLLAALDGAYVPAGPAGSPSRGMAHVLPTGRNFYTVDPRGLPTPAAWSTGAALAREALARHFADKGQWPESIALTVWGTPTMRTGGDDIAQALALLGVRPVWEPETRRTRGLDIIPLSELGRPRIDVTLRVSGFFRDAFPALMHLFDEAVQRVVNLEEPAEQNFVRKHWLAETAALVEQGCDTDSAQRRASYRVFSSKPGAYGTGLMQLMESSAWRDAGDLAEAVLVWGGWAYSPQSNDGVEAVESFRRKLAGIELVLHNQDNVEQDLFDSSDYFEFHGGLVAAVASISNSTPRAYFGDSSNPSHPGVRTLQGEALRVYRSRVVNPKWLNAMQRHGYRGGLEMAATVDSLFGFSATAGIVTDWMFEGIAEAYADGDARRFLQRDNPWALNVIVERLLEAEQRGLWTPKAETLQRLREVLLASEADIEDVAEAPL